MMKKMTLYSGLVTLLLTWGLYFLQLWPKMLFWQGKSIATGWIGVYGDWAAHFSYAAPFAYRPADAWFLSHPLTILRQFTYPFAADALSGLLMRIGFNAVEAFIVPSILTSFLLLIALFYFYYHFTKSAVQTLIAITLFLASGGLGFWWFMQDFLANPSTATLLFPPREYTHIAEQSIEWINVITGQLIAQRALLLGMPIILLFLIVLHNWMKIVWAKVGFLKIALLGAVSSLMLVIHIHSYIVFALTCAIFLLFDTRHWRQWLTFGIAAAIPSLVIYQSLYGGQLESGFAKWYPGWLANPLSADLNWFTFWWRNWGFFLPVSLLAIWKTKYYQLPIVIAGIVVFIVANCFIFQPLAWDNSKLLIWSYLIFCLPVSVFLGKLWHAKRHARLSRILVIALLVVLTASGFLDLWRITRSANLTHQMWSEEDLTLAKQFRQISNPTDRVLVSDQHNSWVSTHTGRQILLGYRGWMWTYGIDYGKIESDMKTMFAGGEQAKMLLHQYKIRYVVIGPTERTQWQANENYFNTNLVSVLHSPNYRVYQVLPDNY